MMIATGGVGGFTDGGYFSGFDLPLLLVILFFIFFLGLVFYLRREDKREGYPLVQDPRDRARPRVDIVGFPGLPKPKLFRMPHGLPDKYAPGPDAPDPVHGDWIGGMGGPLVPRGDPLLSRTGAASWVERADHPDLSYDGQPVFRPLRWLENFTVAHLDADPRGMPILGCDKQVAGEVVDIWADRAEHHARFLEVALSPAMSETRSVAEPTYDDVGETELEPVAAIVTEEHVETPTRSIDITEVDVIYAETETQRTPTESDRIVAEAARRAGSDPSHSKGGEQYEAERATPPPPFRVLVPIEFVGVNRKAGEVRSAAITGAQFANIPGRKSDTMVTSQEEQRIRAYFGGGIRFATPERSEPLI
ncbi:photosynthetic reaction center subunit H [Erythrobacter sp. LQ02-29]|uniref:photosynthetic reaction center subunit H n=1 Tax=Erythrobacter sp. LQ02-29 TaxID=2920384 RepID=UPI001F4E2BF9|nr:photosynthetic reaction center subunit H [Erythrobacter sp. LQ02-29]MCP9223837.1 photosynthetic reaction center subunit H [Erythrobacter sp. LQ02-29]